MRESRRQRQRENEGDRNPHGDRLNHTKANPTLAKVPRPKLLWGCPFLVWRARLMHVEVVLRLRTLVFPPTRAVQVGSHRIVYDSNWLDDRMVNETTRSEPRGSPIVNGIVRGPGCA